MVEATGDRSSVLALRVPADVGEPVSVVEVKASAVALSEQIGGGLLDDRLQGVLDGQRYAFLLDEQRAAKGLPGNERAAVLAARLGRVDREWLAQLHGDALVTGMDARHEETDIPLRVLSAACRAGLIPVRLDV